MGGLDRTFSKIQKLRRVVIPKDMMMKLGWEVDDQIIIEPYMGKILISPVKTLIKPIQERI